MTTIYGSDGASTGHSRDNPALRAKPTSLSELREIPPVNDEQACVSEISDDQFAARGALDPASISAKSFGQRKLRAKPIDIKRLKADNKCVKEMRERMCRLRDNAED